ncbi:WD repeat-containing protein 72-like isoform X5 [Hypanus sabinus]|uniref:WD repeat-containing protein 72-like isoform X5 n=1 Tax=Hypanus sabinus TaxID=79690 RepID=UPI0028C48FE2|nr:WD repeat-containing protein 72-like isoform X5 [Hypanus sabinus]
MKSIVQPIALWGKKAPSHSICALMLTDDQGTIVTGSWEGQICLWNLSPDFKTLPRILMFGHTASITSLGKASEKQPYIVSAAENGEMCLWNVTSGQCIEHTKLPFTHTSIYYYYRSFRMSGDGWLLCCGQYQDILVIDARSLELLHALVSSATPDWISSMCIVRSQRIQEDSLVGISVTGELKVWDLSSSVNGVQARENVYEAESKSLWCFNCQAVCFCTYTERLLLVVCSDCWKVFDYCDFSLLCFVSCKDGHHWAGGEVIAANKIIVWTEDGQSYIYQLPDRWAQVGKPQEEFSSLFKTGIFISHEHSLSETVTPRLLCYTSSDISSKFLQAILIFINERKEPFHKILFCGEASGRISMWHIPDVPMANRDGSPQEIKMTATLSLQGAFEKHKILTEEITDQLDVHVNGFQTGLITASVYIPNLENLVCGCENGRIIITLGLHAARAQLLVEHFFLKAYCANCAHYSWETPKKLSTLGAATQKPRKFTIWKNKAWLPHRILVGHCGRVTSLLHPHSKSATFDASWLASGDEESCVILWNMFKGEALHKFVLHAGPVLNLSVCPEECSPEMRQTICCVANDNSVALLSLQCRACLMHARKHLSPVSLIKWRPAEDLLIVGCKDGAVYVWDIETGTLDRHETGEIAKAIIGSCDDSLSIFMNAIDSLSMGARPLDSVKKKSCKQYGSFKFSTSPTTFHTSEFAFPDPIAQAFTIQPVKAKWSDGAIHVLLFDVSTICEQLLSHQEKEQKVQSTVQSHETLKRLANVDCKKPPMSLKRNKAPTNLCQTNSSVKDLVREHFYYNEHNADGFGREGAGISKHKTKPKGTKKVTASAVKKMDVNVATDTAKLLISCLFPWGVDRDLDELCIKHLGMFQPRCPVSFGLLSPDDYLSLLLPGWYQFNREMTKDHVFCSKISNKVLGLAKQVSNITQACTVSVVETLNDDADENFQSEMTSYLLSVILLVNLQMRMPFLSKGNEMHNIVRQQKVECLRGKGGDASQLPVSPFTGEASQNRSFCLYQSLSKEASYDVLANLITSWQFQSVELLEAIQAMLLAEAQRILRTLTKKTIDRQPIIGVRNGNGEPKTGSQLEQIELQEKKKNSRANRSASVNVVTHDCSPDLEKHQGPKEVADGCAFEESDSPVCESGLCPESAFAKSAERTKGILLYTMSEVTGRSRPFRLFEPRRPAILRFNSSLITVQSP